MPASDCPTRQELFDVAVGVLSEDRAEEVFEHVDSCAKCQSALEGLDEMEDVLVARLRHPPAQSPFALEPYCQALVARAKELIPGRPPTADEPLADPALLRELGEYQLFEKLGQGGMGAVYKARQTRLKKIVALKLLPKDRMKEPRAVARFEREMEAVGALDHPNIVRAMHAGEADGVPYLVVEYVDGVNLAELVRRQGPLPVADACEIARQAAQGLQYAHERGLVHRDVKPSNLMLAQSSRHAPRAVRSGEHAPRAVRAEEAALLADGTRSVPATFSVHVKILDFGLAMLNDVETVEDEISTETMRADATATGQEMGTADYMAPEQAADCHHVDIRADIYSLGCTLYQLLTGRAPFSDPKYKGRAEKLTAHRLDPPPPIREHRPEVPQGLAAIVERMLAKAPADRFTTPADVAEALAPWAAGSDLEGLLGGRAADFPLPPGEGLGYGRGEGQGQGRGASLPLPPGEGRGEGRSKNGTVPFLRRLWRRTGPRRLALAAGAAAAAVVLGIVLLFSTATGTVKIEFADAQAARQCTVSIDGQQIRIERLGEPIVLRPGKHALRIVQGDREIETREFDVVWRGTQVLRVSVPVQAEASRVQYFLDRGFAHAKKNELALAVAEYNQAIALDPRNAEAYMGRGDAYWIGGDLGSAKRDFTRASEVAPKYPRAYKQLAKIHCEEGHFEQGIGYWSKVIELEPHVADAWRGRALARLGAGQRAEYRSECAEIVKRFAGTKDIANASDASKVCIFAPDAVADWTAVLALAEKVAKSDPRSAGYLDLQGMAFYRAGRPAEAIEKLTESRRFLAHGNGFDELFDTGVCYFVSMAHHRLGQEAEAATWFAKALEHRDIAFQEQAAGRVWFSWNLRLEEKLWRSEAESLLPEAAARIYKQRAAAHTQKGRFPEAITEYGHAIRLQPADPVYRLYRGRAYIAKGDLQPAITDLTEAIRLEPALSPAWVARGDAYADQGEAAKAAADFQEALRINPDIGQYCFERCEAFAEQGQTDLVLREFRRMHRTYGQYWPVYVRNSAPSAAQRARLDQALGEFRQKLSKGYYVDAAGYTHPGEYIEPAWLYWLSWWLPSVTQVGAEPAGVVFASDTPWVRWTCGNNNPSPTRNRTESGLPLLLRGLPYHKGIETTVFEDARPADVVIDVSQQKFAVFKSYVLGVGLKFQVLVDGAERITVLPPTKVAGGVAPQPGDVVDVGPDNSVSRIRTLAKVYEIRVDVAGAKEIVLRVLNPGEADAGGTAADWGLARFLPAGAADPFEEPPGQLESATAVNAAFFLAEVHWRLDHKELARKWYDKADQWMTANHIQEEELTRFRAEAAKLLGIPEAPAPPKPDKPTAEAPGPKS